MWGWTEPAIAVGGQVSLRGFTPLVVAQLLFGLQQRCRLEGVHTKGADLRAVCDDFRRKQISSLTGYRLQLNAFAITFADRWPAAENY